MVRRTIHPHARFSGRRRRRHLPPAAAAEKIQRAGGETMNAPLAETTPACPPSPADPAEAMPRSTFFRWRWRVRKMRDASAGFDLRLVKWGACVLALTAFAWSVPNVTVQEIVPWTVMFASILAAA